MRIAGLSLTLPDGFSADEALISFRAPEPALADPRALQKQTTLRPSLIIHRRRVGTAATLEMLAGEIAAELMSTIAGLTAMTTESFEYADKSVGIIVGFDFPAPDVATARQYHALRVDGEVLTTQTLTIDGLKLTDSAKAQYLAQLASITLADGGDIA